MFIYFWHREHEQARGRERGRHRIRSRLQALSCQHRARHEAQTHELWDHDLSWSQALNQLSCPGTPGIKNFKAVSFKIVPKNMKFFDISLTNCMEALYTENYKTLLKGIKVDLNQWNACVHGLKHWILLTHNFPQM